MKRFTLLGVLLATIFAMSAWASASASAACNYCWHVNGKELGAGEERALQGKQVTSFELKGKAFGFIEIAVTCKKLATSGGKLVGGEPGKIEATITYRECTSASCTPTEPIKSPVKGEIVTYTSASKKFLGVVFQSKEANGVFADVECSGLKSEVTGEIMVELGDEEAFKIEVGKEVEAEKIVVNFPGSVNETYVTAKGKEFTAELKWEGKAATLKGQAVDTLEGEKVIFGPFI
jgi:uncharacterized OB-fold protein